MASELGIGEIEIQLINPDGEMKPLVLKPTARATKMISRGQGGLMGAAQRIMQMDVDTFVDIIKIGGQLTEHGAEKLDERVYKSGVSKLATPLIKYVRILSNGGTPPKDENAPGEDGDESPLA